MTAPPERRVPAGRARLVQHPETSDFFILEAARGPAPDELYAMAHVPRDEVLHPNSRDPRAVLLVGVNNTTWHWWAADPGGGAESSARAMFAWAQQVAWTALAEYQVVRDIENSRMVFLLVQRLEPRGAVPRSMR